MNAVSASETLSPERVLTRTILDAFPWNGERRVVSANTIPANLWTELVPAAKLHGLAALFFAALSDTADPQLPAAPLADLRDIYYRSRMANRLANDAVGALLDAFTRAGVPLVVLKGAALSAILYPEPGLRPFGDIDLLIHRADLGAAQSIMVDCGYKMIGERHDKFSEKFLKSLNYSALGPPSPAVDLHWHLFAPAYYRRRITMEYFWRNPLRYVLAGRDAQALAPIQQLVHLSAHAGLHHLRVPLVWLYDMTRWIQRFQPEIIWDEFVWAAQRLELASAIARTLSSAVEWWNAPVPRAVLEQLGQTRSGAGARLVYAIYSSPQGGARSVVDMLYQEGLANKVGYATQLLLPSQEYMEARKPSQSAGLALLYAQRVWRITRFVTYSLWVTLTRARGSK